MSASNRNAVAGVGSRNGVEKIGSRAKTSFRNRAGRPGLASAVIAVLDREGMVLSVVASQAAARSFLLRGAL